MCGRYALKASALDLKTTFQLEALPALTARYNLAPQQAAPILQAMGPRVLTMAQWGLLPPWAKDPRAGPPLINLRSEGLEARAGFTELLRLRRCVVPADGFYEWRREGRHGVPHFLHAADGGLLALAGVWNRWRAPAGVELDTFSILTTAANDDVRPVHARMPVLLDAAARHRWLSPTADLAEVLPLLVPARAGTLGVRHVGPQVNSVEVDDARCLEPPRSVQLRLL